MAINRPGQLPSNMPVTGARVTNQAPGYGPDGSGRSVEGVKVSFVLPSGTPGEVFVPRSMYTVENVKAAVGAHAGVLAAVEGLTT